MHFPFILLREISKISCPILCTLSYWRKVLSRSIGQKINSEEQREKRRLETRDPSLSLSLSLSLHKRRQYRSDIGAISGRLLRDRTRTEMPDIPLEVARTQRESPSEICTDQRRESGYLLDESPAKSCERYSRKSMRLGAWYFATLLAIRPANTVSLDFGDTSTRILLLFILVILPLPFSLAGSFANFRKARCLPQTDCVALCRDSLPFFLNDKQS